LGSPLKKGRGKGGAEGARRTLMVTKEPEETRIKESEKARERRLLGTGEGQGEVGATCSKRQNNSPHGEIARWFEVEGARAEGKEKNKKEGHAMNRDRSQRKEGGGTDDGGKQEREEDERTSPPCRKRSNGGVNAI